MNETQRHTEYHFRHTRYFVQGCRKRANLDSSPAGIQELQTDIVARLFQ